MNKCTIELNQTNSVGDVNRFAFLAEAGQSSGGATGEVALDLNYDWYQNVSHAFVSYKIQRGGAQLKDGGLKVKLEEKEVILENSKNGETLASLDLANPIDVPNSSYTCTLNRIELKLAKAVANMNWAGIEGAAGLPTTAGISAPLVSGAAPAYPSSSKKKKNWAEVDKEMDKLTSKDKPEGDEALNGLFKQIYERSDEETKRAMIKSYQTSGGTVLSTNWGEVNDKDYEGKDRPEAP